jgi:hypothetical protein
MNAQYHVKLNNEYDFKYFCASKSIEVFNHTIDRQSYPSRFSLFTVLLSEAVHSPFYLAGKISEIALYIWNLLSLKVGERRPFHFTYLSNLLALVTLQLLVPLVCTTIRICATITGLLVAHWALEGWKVAESGEQLSYQLWSRHLQDSRCEPQKALAHEEIIPSSAIFYLGIDKVHSSLTNDTINDLDLKNEICLLFSDFLQNFISTHVNCFRKLFYYDLAIHPKQFLSKNNRSYFLSKDTKEILYLLNQRMQSQTFLSPEACDQWLIDQITNHLSIEQMERLFLHLSLNMQAVSINDDLIFNQPSLKKDLTLFSDLFSRYFRFGRAHFTQASHGLFTYLRI